MKIMLIVHRILRKLFPSLTMTREESLKAIASLQRQLNAERKQLARWQARCMRLEQVYENQFNYMKEVARDHSGLHWRIR